MVLINVSTQAFNEFKKTANKLFLSSLKVVNKLFFITVVSEFIATNRVRP